ncbi:MAG TPA: hypothetical protein VFJ24_01040 [Gaiellales bacterium]|nr:hypothetical protein [Gaiellales bacterium]
MTRSCERKRERFLTLYETGRLCGYRSRTIGLRVGNGEGGELAFGQALAHLRHCRSCQSEHGVDASALRARFDARVAVFLPGPVVARDGWSSPERVWASFERLWRGVQRWRAPQAGVRERVVEGTVGGGVGLGVKVAGGIAGVALLAGGAAGVVGSTAGGHERLEHRPATVVRTTPAVQEARVRARAGRHAAPARVRPSRRLPRPSEQRTPGGFSYLGVPEQRAPAAPVVKQRGGGPFGP